MPVDTQHSPAPLVAASDAVWDTDTANQLAISTATRSYTVEVAPERMTELTRVLTEIVPLLQTSESIRRDLSRAQVEMLSPYVEDLVSIGVLLEVPDDVTTEAEGRLFTFLARRADNAEAAYRSAREQSFSITGPDQPVDQWKASFQEQGLKLAHPGDSHDALCIELIVDPSTLAATAQSHHDAGISWTPVTLTPTGATIGPWVLPGETACPACTEPFGELDALSTQPALKGAHASWLSFQEGALRWIGGLLTHSALRVVAPLGPHAPWGRRATIDLLRTEQTTESVWKNPFCRACGPTLRPTPLWTEQ